MAVWQREVNFGANGVVPFMAFLSLELYEQDGSFKWERLLWDFLKESAVYWWCHKLSDSVGQEESLLQIRVHISLHFCTINGGLSGIFSVFFLFPASWVILKFYKRMKIRKYMVFCVFLSISALLVLLSALPYWAWNLPQIRSSGKAGARDDILVAHQWIYKKWRSWIPAAPHPALTAGV